MTVLIFLCARDFGIGAAQLGKEKYGIVAEAAGALRRLRYDAFR
jgi:hypothetical protein